MMITKNPNYSLMKQLAEEVLLSIDNPVLPIKVKPIIDVLTDKDLIMHTYNQYATLENIDYDTLIREVKSKDGTLRYLPDASYVLLYNKNIQQDRKTWTIAHELGHYYAKHHIKLYNYAKKNKITTDEIPEELHIACEREANCFARELLAPTSLMQITMGLLEASDFVDIYTILRTQFRLSKEASYYTAKDMHKLSYPNYSKSLCLKYESAITNYFSTVENRNFFNILLRKYEREIDIRDYKQRLTIMPIGFLKL